MKVAKELRIVTSSSAKYLERLVRDHTFNTSEVELSNMDSMLDCTGCLETTMLIWTVFEERARGVGLGGEIISQDLVYVGSGNRLRSTECLSHGLTYSFSAILGPHISVSDFSLKVLRS